MDQQSQLLRISQSSRIEELLKAYNPTEFITVYLNECGKQYSRGIYCALIPNDFIKQAMATTMWDLGYDDGIPSTTRYGDGRIEYHRFGDDTDVEPLVICREFYGMREGYLELSEEFRLYHNLYHDRKDNKYIKFDNVGNETIIASVSGTCVQVRLKEILQYTAIKEMHFSVQFDIREDTVLTLEEMGLGDGCDETHREELAVWDLCYGEFGGGEDIAFSRLVGKRLFPPFPKEKSGAWGYSCDTEQQYVDFIIGTDEYGSEIKFTADPKRLDSPSSNVPFLTPVHFKKQVLDKYYKEPSKYSVESGLLRCGTLWSMSIDNHHKEYVCVWLGDLGKSLSYTEQQYWASFNIPPVGGISEVYFKRQLLAEPTNSDQPDHIFISSYMKLSELCEKELGWQLLLPLGHDDQYLMKQIRVPSTDEQSEFDRLVQAIAKLLIDSINEKKLNEYIPSEQRGMKGSIAKLDFVLNTINAPLPAPQIAFLRNLQELRSSSTAHRKGKNYKKIASAFSIEAKNLTTVAIELLSNSTRFLVYLIEMINSKKYVLSGS